MDQETDDKFRWVPQHELTVNHPKHAHLLAHYDTWCVADDLGNILVYDTYYLQGNSHKSIAERLLKIYPRAHKLVFMERVYLPDSPMRYV